MDGSGGRGSAVPGQRVVALPGPGPVENSWRTRQHHRVIVVQVSGTGRRSDGLSDVHAVDGEASCLALTTEQKAAGTSSSWKFSPRVSYAKVSSQNAFSRNSSECRASRICLFPGRPSSSATPTKIQHNKEKAMLRLYMSGRAGRISFPSISIHPPAHLGSCCGCTRGIA